MSIDFMIDEAEKSTKETIKALGEENTDNGNEAKIFASLIFAGFCRSLPVFAGFEISL